MLLHSIGWAKNNPSRLPLTIFVNFSIQVCADILVLPILIDAKERVVRGCEENSWEVNIAIYFCSVAPFHMVKWQRGGRGFLGVYWGLV